MYEKYNSVLRAFTGVPFFAKYARELTAGNNYPTTIHAINSCIIKLSALMEIAPVFCGLTRDGLTGVDRETSGFAAAAAAAAASAAVAKRWPPHRATCVYRRGAA